MICGMCLCYSVLSDVSAHSFLFPLFQVLMDSGLLVLSSVRVELVREASHAWVWAGYSTSSSEKLFLENSFVTKLLLYIVKESDSVPLQPFVKLIFM